LERLLDTAIALFCLFDKDDKNKLNDEICRLLKRISMSRFRSPHPRV